MSKKLTKEYLDQHKLEFAMLQDAGIVPLTMTFEEWINMQI